MINLSNVIKDFKLKVNVDVAPMVTLNAVNITDKKRAKLTFNNAAIQLMNMMIIKDGKEVNKILFLESYKIDDQMLPIFSPTTEQAVTVPSGKNRSKKVATSTVSSQFTMYNQKVYDALVKLFNFDTSKDNCLELVKHEEVIDDVTYTAYYLKEYVIDEVPINALRGQSIDIISENTEEN